MGLSLRIEPRHTYLYALFTGTFELSQAKDLSLQILDACVEHRQAKVLVDHRTVQGQMSTMERWDYAVFMADQHLKYVTSGKLRPVQFAYLGTYPLIDPHKFGETVAVNRGVNAKATTDLDEALKWLGVEPAARTDAAQGG